MIKSQNLMEEAYWQIKAMIFRQKIWPGQKLIFRELSKKLNMSKTPIMYALGRLEQEGFLMLEPNLGYSVNEFGPKEIRDYFGVREALEIYAIKAAIHNQKEEDLEELEKKFQKHREYVVPIYDRKKLVLDAECHLQIAKMCRNSILVRQLRHIFEQLYLRYRVELIRPERLSISPAEHQEILDRIRKMDCTGAEQVLRQHIHAARENMLVSLDQQETMDLSISID